VGKATVVIIVGTSLEVYPAAGLMQFAKPEVPKVVKLLIKQKK